MKYRVGFKYNAFETSLCTNPNHKTGRDVDGVGCYEVDVERYDNGLFASAIKTILEDENPNWASIRIQILGVNDYKIMKTIKDLNEIDSGIMEGRLLIMALSKLTCSTYKGKTPNEVLGILSGKAESMNW